MSLPSPGSTRSSGRQKGTNLSEYRALLQVLGYASEKRHDAVDVVHDAVTGGVVAVFRDNVATSDGTLALLPSPKCMTTLSALIAEGFFSPSLTFTLDNPFSAAYQPLTESHGRDCFALACILFPDCFIEASSYADGGASIADANLAHDGEEDAKVLDDENEGNTANNSVSAMDGRRSVSSNSRSVSPAISSSTTATYPAVFNVMGGSHATSTVLAPQHGKPNCSLTSNKASTLAIARSQASVACANIGELHRSRLAVAVTYLAMVNDTLRDVQLRSRILDARNNVHSKTAAGFPPNSQASGADGVRPKVPNKTTPEKANLLCVGNLMEKLKVLILSCICATETGYRSLIHPHHQNGGGNVPQSPGAKGQPSAPTLAPHAQLQALMTDADFFRPVEEWAVWARTSDESDAWYDDQVRHVSDTYARCSRDQSFTEFLSMLYAESINKHGRAITRAPELLLFRATDGHSGVRMALQATTKHFHPPLPHMPLQPGEASLLFSPSDQFLLFDGTPSPVVLTLARWSAHKLLDTQLKEQSDAFFHSDAVPWAALSSSIQQAVREAFTGEPRWTENMLHNNPVLLARVIMWMLAPQGTSESAGAAPLSDSSLPSESLGQQLLDAVLLELPFSISTGSFLRELVAKRALSREQFQSWVIKSLEEETPTSPSIHSRIKTVVALVDFVLVSMRWELDEALSARVAEARKMR